MARIRSVHPGLWTDEGFACLSDSAKILFVGLWTEADDGGCLPWKPLTLKMRLRPATAEGPDDIEAMLSEMVEADLIRRFEVDGRPVMVIRNFGKWQSPRHPTYAIDATTEMMDYAKLPEKVRPGYAESEGDTSKRGKDSAKRGNAPADCGNAPAGEERRGEEGKGEEKQLAARDTQSFSAKLLERVEKAAGADSSKMEGWAIAGLGCIESWLAQANASGIGPERAGELIVTTVQTVHGRNPQNIKSKPSYFERPVLEAFQEERIERSAGGASSSGYKPGMFGSPPPEAIAARDAMLKKERVN